MPSNSRRFQFSLRVAFVAITFVAIASAMTTSVAFTAMLPGLAVLALLAPLPSWLLAVITRSAHPKFPRRIFIAITCITAAIAFALCLKGLEFALCTIVTLIGVWVPQMLFVAFFEWCEYEDRTARAEQAANNSQPQWSASMLNRLERDVDTQHSFN